MSMTNISSLANSFGTTFGLHGDYSNEFDKENNRDVRCLKLKPDEYLSDEDAKKIFDLVITAFKLGADKQYLITNQLSYKFDKENLTVIEYKYSLF